jgi:uncharacterized protein YndB with AHSA1/START domain
VLREIAWVIAALASGSAGAVEVSANGFLVRHEMNIAAPPAKVYDAVTAQVGAWWNAQHTYSGDATNLSIELRPGGCFCERLANGGVEHMRVVQWRQDRLLRLSGGLGPLQGSGVAGSMTWVLSPADNATRLELTYSVGGYIAGGFESIAPAVERVVGEQAARLKRFVETGVAGEAR